MADTKKQADKAPDDIEATNPVAASTPEEAAREQTGAPLFPVTAPEDTVFERPETREVQAEVNDEAVPVRQHAPIKEAEETPVYEVYVTTDEQVTYNINPPEGRGDATLPIHAFVNAKTPEQQFKDSESK